MHLSLLSDRNQWSRSKIK